MSTPTAPLPATLGRRLLAMLYDTLLVSALLFLTTLPFIAANGGEPIEASANTAYQIALLVVIFSFFVGFWSLSGRTLGMQSWGLQLESPTGHKPSTAAATLRFFASLLSLAALCLGFLWQLWDRDKMSWHDRISNTRLMHYPRKK